MNALPNTQFGAHHQGMSRVPVRSAALQVGEFAVGVTVAYAAIGATWSLSHSIWSLLVATAVIVGVAIMIELRYGAKATGFVVGMLPTSMLVAALLVAMSLVVYRLN
jgi:hypothetical protein